MTNNVLVYESDGIVRADIIETVNEMLGKVDLHVVDSLAAVTKTLDSYKGWALAIVNASSDDLASAGLGAAFARNNASPVVLSAGTDDPAMKDWVFLDPPFDTRMLRDALSRSRPG